MCPHHLLLKVLYLQYWPLSPLPKKYKIWMCWKVLCLILVPKSDQISDFFGGRPWLVRELYSNSLYAFVYIYWYRNTHTDYKKNKKIGKKIKTDFFPLKKKVCSNQISLEKFKRLLTCFWYISFSNLTLMWISCLSFLCLIYQAVKIKIIKFQNLGIEISICRILYTSLSKQYDTTLVIFTYKKKY